VFSPEAFHVQRCDLDSLEGAKRDAYVLGGEESTPIEVNDGPTSLVLVVVVPHLPLCFPQDPDKAVVTEVSLHIVAPIRFPNRSASENSF
jgi:hypothetical protein